MDLLFQVNGQKMFRYDTNLVVAGSENFLLARFRFSEEWNGMAKSAIFQSSGGAKLTVPLQSDFCEVPPKVLMEGNVAVSVFGGYRLTTNIVTFRVEPTGFDPMELPSPPAPDTYQQILDMAVNASLEAKAAHTYRIFGSLNERDSFSAFDGMMCFVRGDENKEETDPDFFVIRGFYFYNKDHWTLLMSAGG